MANFTLNLDIATMKWTDAAGLTLYTGDNFEFPAFLEYYYEGTKYSGITVNLQNGVWKDCGSTQTQGTSLTITLPTPGEAYTKPFCVCASECFEEHCYRKGWFDPQLKLKNQDSTGAPSQYASPAPCTCV